MGIEQDRDAKADTAEKAGSPGKLSSADNPLDEERIRALAYSIWMEEGQPEGRELDHWMRARGELERKAA
jgi:Protein of unknown function (DUF2934)